MGNQNNVNLNVNSNTSQNNNMPFRSTAYQKADTAMLKKKIKYKYIAFDKSGKQIKGSFDAFKRSDVESFLMSQGYKIAEIKESKVSSSFFSFQREMSYKDINFFLTQLSTYIKSGIPLTEAVTILSNQTKKKNHRELFKKIVYELNTGVVFSEALARQGNTFPKLLINMLKASELTGNLTETLDDMASYYKNADSNRKQIISALTYPSVVLVVAIAILTFLLIYIVPQFQNIFDQLGADLPGITLALISASNFVRNNIIAIVLVVFSVIIILVVMYKNISKFRYVVQWLLMHIPVIKDILIYNEVIMFTKTFASLVKHDVFITDSIEMLGKITNNEIFKGIIKDAVGNLSVGNGLAVAFENKWAFPRIAYEMLLTGEKTGRLGPMMENVANYYEEEQKNLTQRLKSLIEPVMIILLAGIVGVVLLAIFVPMFDMYNSVL